MPVLARLRISTHWMEYALLGRGGSSSTPKSNVPKVSRNDRSEKTRLRMAALRQRQTGADREAHLLRQREAQAKYRRKASNHDAPNKPKPTPKAKATVAPIVLPKQRAKPTAPPVKARPVVLRAVSPFQDSGGIDYISLRSPYPPANGRPPTPPTPTPASRRTRTPKSLAAIAANLEEESDEDSGSESDASHTYPPESSIHRWWTYLDADGPLNNKTGHPEGRWWTTTRGGNCVIIDGEEAGRAGLSDIASPPANAGAPGAGLQRKPFPPHCRRGVLGKFRMGERRVFQLVQVLQALVPTDAGAEDFCATGGNILEES
ncbi:hypothetical protein C8F04DRAFT_1179781 [Mycena alexandri]|uniref:Uncharacterized protein n=1 Tax=Mycena alexandri TaxID=1745969 RepID=A0AAD6T2H2_9AGAR|nr:hypothetical protein C8F04DRAFT_1179781 [Mycena alexandri]